MTGFRKVFPQVRFYMEQSDSETVWDSIMENDGELGFTGGYKNNGLRYDLLFKDPMMLITSKNENVFKACVRKSQYISKEEFLGRELCVA